MSPSGLPVTLLGVHHRLLAITYLPHNSHSHNHPAQVSSLWAQPASHLSLYLQSPYTQQVTTEHLGTGLAVSPGRLLSRATSAPESQGRGALLSICPSGLRGPRHTPPHPYPGHPRGRADRKSEVCPQPSARAELRVIAIRGCGPGPALHRGAGYRFWLRCCRLGPRGQFL